MVSDFFRQSSSAASTPRQGTLKGGEVSGADEDEEVVARTLLEYEQGERGVLSDVYASTLSNWLDFCHEQGR